MTSTTQRPHRPWPWRRIRLVSLLCGVVALVLAAGAGGWWLADRTLVASFDDGSVEPTATGGPLVLTATMPDVRGLTQDDAVAVLADSGIVSAAVTIEEAPSALETGTIVGQTPAFGAELPDAVVLRVAVPASVPDLAGVSRDDAVSRLLGLGATPDLVFAYDATAAPGTVLAVQPAAGQPLPTDVVVTIATAGSTVPLSDVATLGRACASVQSATIDGDSAQSAIVCELTDSVRQTTWRTGRLADRLTATLGVDDSSAPGSAARVEILADGVTVFDQTVSFGSTVPVDVDLAAAIQLTVRITPSAPVTVVLADAVLYGSEAAIDQLGSQ